MGEQSEVDEELVARDLPEFLHVLEEMKEKVPVVTRHVEQLLCHVTSPETSTKNGISLLDVKVQLLLSSLINLVQLMLMKTEGESISASPPVLRLVEIRTVLEKLRPLDQKLRYQVDKLIRMAKTGLAAAPGNDPLRFRANPSNMVTKLGDEDGRMSGESDEEEERAKLYVPPRVVAMPYDGDDDEGVKERKRKKKVQSSIVQELRNEYLDIPEEVNDVGSGFRSHRETKEEKEREMFEEANFIRLPKKRKGQGTRQRGGASDVLDDLDLGAFPSGSAHQPGSGGKKKLSARKRSAGGSKTKRGHRHK